MCVCVQYENNVEINNKHQRQAVSYRQIDNGQQSQNNKKKLKGGKTVMTNSSSMGGISWLSRPETLGGWKAGLLIHLERLQRAGQKNNNKMMKLETVTLASPLKNGVTVHFTSRLLSYLVLPIGSLKRCRFSLVVTSCRDCSLPGLKGP